MLAYTLLLLLSMSEPKAPATGRDSRFAGRRLVVIIAAAAVVTGVALYGFLAWRYSGAQKSLTLYGNVDIREAQLAFNDNERITNMLVQEGDFVHPGELIAQLETSRYAAAAEQAEKQAANQRQVLTRLLNGSRPEEIVQARSTTEALKATFADAKVTYHRNLELRRHFVIPEQTLDDSLAQMNAARGNYEAANQAYILAVKGPRIEDINAARELLKADEAALALAQRELHDTRLYAPSNGVIEDRILEPGDMASPGAPVFTMALTNPLWVRAYVPEVYLGKIYLGMKAAITTDSYPGKNFDGWVGYISPTAEFTPKNVETPELRTRLVYQVRVYACNPQNELRLGMPATVTLALDQPIPSASQVNGLGCGSQSQPDGQSEIR
jgi:HlyD family secretion protein